MDYKEILKFWFEELMPNQWYVVDDNLDQAIRERFSELYKLAIAGKLKEWRENPHGCLAEVIILDQFSRNMYRNHYRAFAADDLALELAQEAIDKEFDLELEQIERSFLYLPFMHSESREVHEKAVLLYQSLGLESNLDYEYKHKAIIDRFGRYPHRNAILNRESTDEEIEFLKQPNSSF